MSTHARARAQTHRPTHTDLEEAHFKAGPDLFEFHLLVPGLIVHVMPKGEEVCSVRKRHDAFGLVLGHREQVL